MNKIQTEIIECQREIKLWPQRKKFLESKIQLLKAALIPRSV